MAGVQVVVRKMVPFQGREEEFSNVYYFTNAGASIAATESEASAILAACIERERPIFATIVQFLGGSVRNLGPFGGPVAGEALHSAEQPPGTVGTGGTANTSMYRECAVQVRWLLGGRRFLRSMLHTCLHHNYDLTGVNETAPAQLSAGLKAYADANLQPLPNGYRRTSPGGDIPGVVGYSKYLEHRQFHEGRKRIY